MSASADSPMKEFARDAVQPACVEFARRLGTGTAEPWSDGGRVGWEVSLPAGLKDSHARTAIACAEPFDDEAFTVKVSRPDMTDQLRQVAQVRFDDMTDASEREKSVEQVHGLVFNALNQLQQGLETR